MTTPKVKPTITANPMTICTFLTRNSPPILAEVFYYVNYVNVNYSVKNSTVDCKYLLYFL